jgi:hypothetical protein
LYSASLINLVEGQRDKSRLVEYLERQGEWKCAADCEQRAIA